MITENLLFNAEERVRSLCAENNRLIFWVYVLLGISSLFSLILIYCWCYGKLCFYKGTEFQRN
jgi:hypothetical protein